MSRRAEGTDVGAAPPRFRTKAAAVRLVVVGGPDLGLEAAVRRTPRALGTGRGNAIALSDPYVSRRHAVVRWRGTALEVQDEGSTNGTFVGDCRVEHALIPCGAVVRVGRTTLQVLPAASELQAGPGGAARLRAVVGGSASAKALAADVERLARVETPVLIEGEVGVGKHRVAEGLHRLSGRAGRPLQFVDCSMPAPDVAVALFGSVTDPGAHGALVAADGGTVVLERIDRLPPALRGALRRVIDRRSVIPVGSATPVDVDVRILSTCAQDPAHAAVQRALGEDLYFRIAAVRLRVPPLRERTDDLVDLVQELAGAELTLSPETWARLRAHDWPGNVRELAAVVRQLAHDGGDVGLTLRAPTQRDDAPIERFRKARSRAIETFERGYLASLMSRFDAVAAAAAAAAMDRKQLRSLLRRYRADAD